MARADVVVANLPPKALAALRLDYESLRAVKPDIVLTTATAYGRGGPLGDRPGFDGVGQAMSGAIHLGGTRELPARAPVPYVDFCTATLCAFGTLGALMARARTGQGQLVEASLLLSSLSIANYALIEQAVAAPDRAALRQSRLRLRAQRPVSAPTTAGSSCRRLGRRHVRPLVRADGP